MQEAERTPHRELEDEGESVYLNDLHTFDTATGAWSMPEARGQLPSSCDEPLITHYELAVVESRRAASCRASARATLRASSGALQGACGGALSQLVIRS